MIPRRLFWLLDLAVFSLAFSLAYRTTPFIVTLAVPSGPLAAAARWPTLPPWAGQVPPAYELLGILVAVAVTATATLGVLGGHENLLRQSRARIAAASLAGPLVGLGVVSLAFYAFRSWDWSRLFVFSFIGFSVLGLATYRLILRWYFERRQRAGVYARNVLLLGCAEPVRALAQAIAVGRATGDRRIVGWLHSTEYAATPEEKRPAVPCLGEVAQLDSLLIRRPIHEVIAVQPMQAGEWISRAISDCDQVGVPIRIVPEVLLGRSLSSLQPTTSPTQDILAPALLLAPRHFDSDALFVKRVMDVFVSGSLLVLLAPLFAVVALLVKATSRGPVFYRWQVVGEQGVEFTGYKFRTMVIDADARKADLMTQNEMKGPVFKMKNDPRITKVGRFLRKYSLDELPQLYSVLKGDMSLVGPRPAFRTELERYEYWQRRKLSTRPGITCLWQVQGRNRIIDFDEWVRLDLEYIDNWSLWLDVKILARTAWTVLAGTGV
jgi:exopolysaccharide biosynthesis polyprenyl glycosylphosphotransferase